MKYTPEQRKAILGNQPSWALKNMVKALSMGALMNTPEENERLEAGKEEIKARSNSARNANRRAKHEALTSLGLVRVKGALGGVYYE